MDTKWHHLIRPAAVAVCLLAALPAAAAPPELALGPGVTQQRMVLIVHGPGELAWEQAFPAGTTPVFNLFDAAGNPRVDGVYTWELRPAPVKGTRVRDGATPEVGKSKPSQPLASGYFSVIDGGFAQPELKEEVPLKDIVHLDDVIIDGSLCVGNDCYRDYDFGYDTIVLRENNLRIYFEDTSSIAGYPTNDWRITINDSTSGGASRFSIEDVDDTSVPFTIEAGTPDHALYVEDMGRIGFGTSTPAVELHVVDGDSPTLRLEQDGSFGFTPQTWDITSNETNFFVRDATGGSRLPFRIQPGAPSSSLTIRSDGKVGMGTWSPSSEVHVERSSAGFVAGLELENTGGDVGFRLTNDEGSVDVNIIDDAGTQELRINFGAAPAELRLQEDGDLIITGSYTPDYVFEPDYPLMPLEALAAFIDRAGHLPNVPSDAEVKQTRAINVGAFQMTLLEKIEELTLYTLAQEETIRSLEEVVDQLRTRLAALEESNP